MIMTGSMLGIAMAFVAGCSAGPDDSAGAQTEVSEAVTGLMESAETLPDFTIYRPSDMDSRTDALPVVVYGNGGCIHIGSLAQNFLREVAANGYFVIAPGAIGPVPDFGNPSDEIEQYETAELTKAMDWAVAENAREGSPLAGRLDNANLTVMGSSCGGLQALAAGSDPRVTSVVVLNSGIIRNGGVTQPDGTVEPRSFLPASEEDLANLHTPVLYLVGGPGDQAFENAETDFEMIDHVPLFNGNMDVGHSGTFREPHGGAMGQAAIDWLDWQTKGDEEAAMTFLGEDCRLCTDPEWTFKRKNL